MADTRVLDLDTTSLHIVRAILDRHVPERPVFAFGSRTRGHARRRSDLDLAVGGSEPIGNATMSEIRDDFSQSDLPIFVDVLDINSMDEGFLQRIQSDFVPLPFGEQHS